MDELTQLADLFRSDKGSIEGCSHGFTSIYHSILAESRDKPLRILEIGLMHHDLQARLQGRYEETGCPSLRMWANYLPNAEIFGFDIVDFRALAGNRVKIFQGDQGDRQALRRLVEHAGGNFDVIIDDGSHAAHHQQISLATLFPHLSPGGMYFIEDLHYRPTELEIAGITPTREFLRDLRFGYTGARVVLDQLDLAELLRQVDRIHFFDSQSAHWPLARREDALAVVTKRGQHRFLTKFASGLFSEQSASPDLEIDSEVASRLPSSFVGHAAVQGQRIFCGSVHGAENADIKFSMPAESLPFIDAGFRRIGNYRLGDDIDFRLGGNAPLYQHCGWDRSTTGGTWTVASDAQLRVKLVDKVQGEKDFCLEILAQGLVGKDHRQTNAEISINDASIGTVTFGYQEWQRLQFCASENEDTLIINIRTTNPISPYALGQSEDIRDLGLLFVCLRIARSPSFEQGW